jgi:hypothetical protein
MRLFSCLLLLATISVPSLFAGDGCTYKQPPLFKDQDIHMSDGVCQRCEDGIWVDRYCSVCQQAQGAHAGASASAKTNKQSTRTKTSSAGANAYRTRTEQGKAGQVIDKCVAMERGPLPNPIPTLSAMHSDHLPQC